MGCSSITIAILVAVCFTVASSTGTPVNPLAGISTCKIKCSNALKLCRNEVAKTPTERLDCAKLFVATFPSCYFGLVAPTLNCDGSILESFSKCVMESLSYGETFSCSSRKLRDLKKCKSASSKREQTNDPSSMQACNECFGNYDICIGSAQTMDAHDICVASKSYCARDCWPTCLHFAAPHQN